MKILHIIENTDVSYGGPAKSVPLLIKYLNKLNINNKILTIKVYKHEENNIITDNKIDIVKLPLQGFRKIKYSSKLKNEIVKNLTTDTIIHVHSLWNYTAYISYKIAKEYNIPLIVSVRGTMYDWALAQRKYIKKFAMWFFQKDMLKYASVIHVTAKNEINAVKKLGIENNFVLIPNGIEIENEFHGLNLDILNKIKYDENKRYIMFLGRIVHNKGLHYLIESFQKNKTSFHDIELLIVGGIEEEKYYKTLEHPIGVHFMGMLDGIDKHTIFSISSLFVLPSKGENFSMAIAEAMSYRLPVITTTGTPWKELKEKNAGWWVELNQFNIDNAMNEALRCTQNELKIKGDKCFNIIKNYIWSNQADKMKKCYLGLLKKAK